MWDMKSSRKAAYHGSNSRSHLGDAARTKKERPETHVVFVLANFSEHPQRLEARRLRQMGMRKTMMDIYAGRAITATQELTIEPYQLMVLTRVT